MKKRNKNTIKIQFEVYEMMTQKDYRFSQFNFINEVIGKLKMVTLYIIDLDKEFNK